MVLEKHTDNAGYAPPIRLYRWLMFSPRAVFPTVPIVERGKSFDLILSFMLSEMGISCYQEEATLSGETEEGEKDRKSVV